MVQRVGELGYQLNFDASAVAKISEAGFDPVYGARPLKRAIQNLVENPLAEVLLKGVFDQGQRIHVRSSDSGRLEFVSDVSTS